MSTTPSFSTAGAPADIVDPDAISREASGPPGMLERLPERFRPSFAANMLLFAIAGFFLVFLVWASFAKLDVVSRAHGRVIPSRQLQVVSNLEGGIVREILVREGQEVEKGQVLIRLDPTQFTAEFGKNEEGYNALVARMTRLQAEINGRPLQFDPALVRDAPQVVAAERALFEARRHDLEAALNIARAKLDQAERASAEAAVAVETRREAKELADRELALVKPLVDKGIEPQIQLIRAQSAATQADGEYRAAQLAAQRARSAVAEARYELTSVRERFMAQSVDALAQAEGEFASMGATLPALEDRVARTEIRAPVSGTVNRVLVATVGGVVKPGEPLVEIVPSDDSLVIKAQVSPAEIAFIAPGQKAFVKLTAYDFSIYGGLEGTVERISPDATVDERTGESSYSIQVRTKESGLRDEDGRSLPISPGMVAEVDVLGEKRSVMSYILTPLSRIQQDAFRER